MDFISQYNTSNFKRTTTTFLKGNGTAAISGSTQALGGAFIILNASVVGNTPCRLRLYSDETSRDTDKSRPTGSFNLTQSVALITDIVFTNNNTINFDPPIIGNTYDGGNVWYNFSGSNTSLTASVTTYQIGISNDSLEGRTGLSVSASSIPTTGYGVSGSIVSPKSFIILSGSATSESRLRLYSRPIEEVTLAEMTRSFDTQSQDSSLLIADLMFDSGSFQYPLVPVLEAYTWGSSNYSVGNNQVGYILENRSVGTTDITASLYIYSTEE